MASTFSGRAATKLQLVQPVQTGSEQFESAGLYQHSEPPGGFSFYYMLEWCQANTATHKSMLINKWNRRVYPSHRHFLSRSSSSLTALDWIALKSFPFCLSTTCQNCISGARPGGIMFNSIFKNSFLSSIPSLWASEPAATDRWRVSEPLRLCRGSAVSPVCQGAFQWARRPGRRFGDGIRLHILTGLRITDPAESKSHQIGFFFLFYADGMNWFSLHTLTYIMSALSASVSQE